MSITAVKSPFRVLRIEEEVDLLPPEAPEAATHIRRWNTDRQGWLRVSAATVGEWVWLWADLWNRMVPTPLRCPHMWPEKRRSRLPLQNTALSQNSPERDNGRLHFCTAFRSVILNVVYSSKTPYFLLAGVGSDSVIWTCCLYITKTHYPAHETF